MNDVPSVGGETAGDDEARKALTELGFSRFFAEQSSAGDDPGWRPLRVVSWDGSRGEVLAERCFAAGLSGKYWKRSSSPPTCGDWVLGQVNADHVVIERLLTRQSSLVRRAAGHSSVPQVVVANIDVLLVVTSANRELNERRLERYLAAAWDSGAQPVVVINKVDLVEQPAKWIERVSAVALGVEVVAVSASSGYGLELLNRYAGPGRTVALIGSSGVGKSSLINRWLGVTVQATGTVDDEQRGRHTTTRRSLIRLPQGGLLIDTPGMREFGLADSDGGLDVTFEDVVSWAENCRFSDCCHTEEPGCAVRAAVDDGRLPAERLTSYLKLQREARAARARTDQRLAQRIKQQNKVRTRAARALAGAKRRQP